MKERSAPALSPSPFYPMSPLQIVYLEASAADAAMVRAELERNGLECTITHAQTEEEFVEALGLPEIDLILAARMVNGFDGMQALALAREQLPNVPFILVGEA